MTAVDNIELYKKGIWVSLSDEHYPIINMTDLHLRIALVVAEGKKFPSLIIHRLQQEICTRKIDKLLRQSKS